MKKLYIILVLFLITGFSSFGQDPQFTQFYAAPLYLNPAFAGATLRSRAVFNARDQWSGLPKPFVTYAASVDHNFEKYRSGLGLLAVFDKSGTGGLSRTSISAIYSYKVNLNSRWVFRPAVQFGYSSQSINFYKFTFGDQLDLNQIGTMPTSETFSNNARVNYFDFSSGALLHNDKVWFGVSTHHLNRPNQSLNQGMSILPIEYNFHGGIKIDVSNPLYRGHGKVREQSITPAFLYKMQGKYDQLDVGLYYHYEPLVIGVWYRGIPLLKSYKPGYSNNDAIAVLLGFKKDNFSFGYSYDLTISKLGPTKTAGSHEISLSYTFGETGKSNRKPRMRRKDMVIPCPKF